MAAPTTTPAIRLLRPSDHATFRALAAPHAHQPGAAHHSPSPVPYGERWRELSAATFDAYVATGCSYIAEVDGQLAGYLLAQPISFSEGKPLTIWVDDLAVHPDHHGPSIGAALYHALGTRARGEGVKAILTRLDTNSEAALTLHQRIGFEPHGTGAIVWRLESE